MDACVATSEPCTTSSRPRPATRCTPRHCSTSARSAAHPKPSAANQEAFERAVHEVAHATRHLLDALVTSAPAKNREEEAIKARARSAQRYARA
ncbi:MAG TPA: DUF2277 family protein [Jatrophihabitans sp.]|nr:DUF2277 family protein [Jatrophihabitans sp.]